MIARCMSLVVCSFSLPFAALADDGPAAAVPELEAISRFVGDHEMRVTEGIFGATSGTGTGSWALGGRFIEQNGSMMSADGTRRLSVKTLYTYDSQAGVYRSWTFTSDGAAIERSGTFDAQTQTLTLVGRLPNGQVTTQTSDFSDPDQISWRIVAVTADGAERVINAGVTVPKE